MNYFPISPILQSLFLVILSCFNCSTESFGYYVEYYIHIYWSPVTYPDRKFGGAICKFQIIIIIHVFRNLLFRQCVNTVVKFTFHDQTCGLTTPLLKVMHCCTYLRGLTEKAIHLLMETFFSGWKTYGKRHHMILNITSICSS